MKPRLLEANSLAKAAALLVAFLLAPLQAAAHEGLHEQIAEVTRQIKQSPNSAALYLKRGELHRLHRDWKAALADYDRAEALDPRLEAVHFGRGRMFHEAGNPRKAKPWLDRFLARNPNHVEALVTRARVLVKMGQLDSAAADYSRAIAQMPKPKPEYYLERARALVAHGADRRDEALSGIDEAIGKLGHIVTLELFAIDLEVAGKRYDAAIRRLDLLAAQSPRKESWLVRRGEILRQAGRAGEAREAFAQALAAIESLPAYHRKNRATLELEARVRAALRQ
jgi:tetratricopeptide (TPR) repeat protein